jgi:hypothetical protein
VAVSLHLEGVIREGVYTMVVGPTFSLQFCLQVAVSLHLEGVIRKGVYTMVGGPAFSLQFCLQVAVSLHLEGSPSIACRVIQWWRNLHF